MTAGVAIVGIGCRFPGGVVDPASFWALLREGRSGIGEIPDDRMDLARWVDPRPGTPARMSTRLGGFLGRIDQLDAAFFGISPREAERLDPQQRLLLETAWEALEDAGEDARRLEGSRTGVFVGQWISDFEARLASHPEDLDFFMTTGSGRYAASGRLSFALGLRGPSVTLDTACSSSLVAVHLAVRSLRSGECDAALAGGVNVILQPHVSIAYSQSGMLAADGRCKFGDAAADGYVRSEGAGVVLLKPLERALADGDRIYAVIRGSAVNNDGRSSGSLGTPSRAGQEELLRAAHRDAGIPAERVRYVEAHGTGTRSGDPVELGALAAVLREGRVPGRRALVGSVKTNLGHTEGAAGVAGLIKVALALHEGAVPPSLHLRTPTPAVAWDEAPFAVPGALSPWPEGEGPRVAGVSAFGIAGTNAHVVVEEAPALAPRPPAAAAARPVAVLPLSARSVEALRALAGRHADLLSAEGGPGVRDVCFAAATRRTALERRAAVVGADRAALVDALRRYAAGEPAAAEGTADAAPARVAFVVPGQGGQWRGMARELLAGEPVFREAVARCDAAARRVAGLSILEQLEAAPGSPGDRLGDIDVIQPVLTALAIGYAALLRSLGIEPAAIVGHSMGEVAAAHLAGVLDLDAAMRVVCRRSALMRAASGRGAMALVELSAEDAQAAIRGREDRLSVAVRNAPRSCVLSGDPSALDEVLAELEARQVFCRRVKVDVASHGPQMEPLAAALARELADLEPAPAALPLVSTTLGRRAEGRELDGAHWGRNLRQPVRFEEAVRALVQEGVTAFVELGPHPVLLPSIEQTVRACGRAATTVAAARREEPELAVLLEGAAALWAAGASVDWRAILPPGAPVRLPLYPWQRERHWVAAAELSRGGPGERTAAARPDGEALGWLHQLRWQPADTGGACASGAAPGRWLVVGDDPAARALSGALGAGAPVPLGDLEAALAAPPPAGAAPVGIAVVAAGAPGAAYLPVRALQALLRSRWRDRARLWFLTRGAQAAGGRASRVAVEEAALWGAARVVGEEHPELWGGLADLEPAAAPDDAAAVAAHLRAADGEDQVAFRAGRRLALRIAPAGPLEAAPFRWRPDATYVVTGGLGDLGLHVARVMVAGGARRLALLGRTPLPPRETWAGLPAGAPAARRVAAVRELEALGAAIHVVTVDVGDEAQLGAWLDRHAAEGWPPIRGVVHAAAVLQTGLAASMAPATFEAVTRPKLEGARNLDRLLPELDVFVLFSSFASFLAMGGEAGYAAANAGLDALAQDRRARGQHALSVAWGQWNDCGLSRGDARRGFVAELARRGLRGFSPEQGAALFAWLCSRDATAAAVLPIDWTTFARSRGSSLYRHLAGAAGAGVGVGADTRSRLETAGPAERAGVIEGVVRECVGRVLKLAPARLDARQALGSMGLTSLLGMELRNRLEVALGRALPATLAFNYPTIAALVEHLAGAPAAGAPVPPAAPRAEAIAPPTLGGLAALTDEEAARALRASRRRGA